MFPVNYFGVALGTEALALAWRFAARSSLVPALPTDILGTLAIISWGVLVLSYCLKLVLQKDAVRAEFDNLILACFIALIPITTIEAAMILVPVSRTHGVIVAAIGIIGQLIFAVYRTPHLWLGNHTVSSTTPMIYLPAVASNFASAAYLGNTGHHDLGWLFLGAGVLSWLSLEPAILRRLRTEQQIAPESRGMLGI